MAGKTPVSVSCQLKKESCHVSRVLDLVLENYGSWVKFSLVLFYGSLQYALNLFWSHKREEDMEDSGSCCLAGPLLGSRSRVYITGPIDA